MRLFIGGLAVVTVVSLFIGLSGKGQTNQRQHDGQTIDKQRAIQKRVHVEDYPLADYDSPESSDSQERDKRKARNHRYDLSSDVKGADINRFTIKEDGPDISIPLSVSHPKTEPGIPAAESQAIALGEVISAHAYLSNDKTSVYSEFTVRVADVLKNENTWSLYPGAQIEVERSGGRLRFPSGKVLLRGAPYGKNMPRLGQRYLFFLKQNDEGHSYSIITAYELRSGSVYPLDRSPDGDLKSRQFAEYEAYSGMDETTFISHVLVAIQKVGKK
jgi:hypothetical protein